MNLTTATSDAESESMSGALGPFLASAPFLGAGGCGAASGLMSCA